MPDKRPPPPAPSVWFKPAYDWIYTVGIAALYVVFVVMMATHRPQHPVAESTLYLRIGDMGHGSGVHIGNGYVLTAAHVADNPEAHDPVRLVDSLGHKHKVEIMWVNHKYDLALLRMRDAKSVASSKLSCRYLDRGEKLTFAGNPLGLKNITTYGQVANPAIISYGPWKAINSVSGTLIPGMSGGPVFDGIGNVVGINVGLATDPQLARDQDGNPVAEYEMSFALSFIVPGRTICQLMDR